MVSKVLGKGLSALIPGKEIKDPSGEIAFLDINQIKDNSQQPRVNYASDKLEELKMSIKEKGVLQPILVREKDGVFEVIAGERRLKAARLLHLDKVPAIIKDVSDQDALVISLVENIQSKTAGSNNLF